MAASEARLQVIAPARVDGKIAAFDEAAVARTPAQRVEKLLPSAFRTRQNQADAMHGLLREYRYAAGYQAAACSAQKVATPEH